MVGHWLVLAGVLALVAAVGQGVEIDGGPVALLIAAAVLGLVNALLGPVLRLLTAPLTLATLGLFSLVVNTVLLYVAAALTDRLDVGGPIHTFLAAIVISVLNALLGKLLLSD
ncbi:MAG: hypothetical protein CMH83_13370 [Nocardioides sp.]|nr:hypothetical protein [Nocardioides sp.]